MPPERAAVPYYRLIAHAPRLRLNWYRWVEALRWDVACPRHYRELALLRTVQLVGGEPAWAYHAPGAGEFGITAAQIRALKEWRTSHVFDARERAVLRCCDELHERHLGDAAFAELQQHFTDEEIVELVVTASFYQCVPRAMQGLGVAVEPGLEHHVATMR